MTQIVWGEQIETGGKRPDWLRDGEDIVICDKVSYSGTHKTVAHEQIWWPLVHAIKLPQGHPYYIATGMGFTYWPGGDTAPAGWNGGDVLRRGGNERYPHPYVAPYEHNQRWSWESPVVKVHDIIGYRRMIWTPVDMTASSGERVKGVIEPAGVLVQPRSAVEWVHLLNTHGGLREMLTVLGLVTPATDADIARQMASEMKPGDTQSLILAGIRKGRELERGETA